MSFTEHFRRNVEKHGDRQAVVFVRDDASGEPDSRTYRDLDLRARKLATWLNAQAAQAGDGTGGHRPVLLLYPPGIDFLEAFFGCLYAGVVAVPAPVPADPRSFTRVTGMVADAGVGYLLTTSDLVETIEAQLRQAGFADQVTCAATDAGLSGDAAGWSMPELSAESLAFLQYTSGSTSEPKGVMVTHGNLLHNQAEIQRINATGPDTILSSWLPHFHDMGLIGMLLHPLYLGGKSVFLSPIAFLKRPWRWMDMLSRYRATMTCAPNFAYDMCARKVRDEHIETLDLSALVSTLNGAEPVRAETLDRFAERFSRAGFRAKSFAPCYGMAEVTLIASGGGPDDAPVVRAFDARALERNEAVPATAAGFQRLVSSGRPGTLDLRIVDPEDRTVLGEGRIGEIWIRGGSVAAGYWNRPQETAETFGAHTSDGTGPFLRTGDLGFSLDGELFVTGRLKDVLIINGRNIYPQDIEHVVRELHPALAGGGGTGAVFSVDLGFEHIVVVHEVQSSLLGETTLPELAARIRVAVSRSFEIAAPSVLLTGRGKVRRTTSGKVQRRLMRTLFMTPGALPALHEQIDPALRALRAPGDDRSGEKALAAAEGTTP
ncbi:acyl-CoA synthetase (AMP-forming)/AMP-acid ligase II [Frankia torreyi]|uniref:Acyl-CoA synthetase (AMP-forming)/AMP-acid ligase II n=1 Tax=Frankia torreyi TaxID=1856 RepID=A0A0D8BFV2_9ACTN|nr:MULTISPECIES: fatty acyl-AMP ligase [Frankia]KJE23031.1 acyl-CoA synthetase (AMP-forming)/AMP-acid ligase II [Frankia torreyi]